MSKYTTELRFICEELSGLEDSVGYDCVDNVIQSAIPKIFSFDFPVFDEAYRNVLCTKILKHFYTREIGFETYGLWKLKLNTKLNEKMPYFNRLYESTLLKYNPLVDTEYTREGKRDDAGTDKTTSTTQANSTNESHSSNSDSTIDKYSDTPQGTLDNVLNGTYLTTARDTGRSGSADGSASSNYSDSGTTNKDLTNTSEYIEKISGKRGTASYSSLIKEFRETFINVDEMVLDSLEPLFMGLW